MLVLLAFALTLLAAVLLSALAHRSVLSTAVLFLVAGFLFGPAMLGWVPLSAKDPRIIQFLEIAMFAVLFADGMDVDLRDLRRRGGDTARALFLGMPLSILALALLARFVVGMPWLESFLIGGALSPTDPVLASALVGREEAPERLRKLLNLESGLNDGLALPIVLPLLAAITPGEVSVVRLLGEAALAVALGVAVPWLVIRLEESRFFAAADNYGSLIAFTIGLLVLALADLTHANKFLAAFTAGMMTETFGEDVSEKFEGLGNDLAEILKLAALLVFGSLISLRLLASMPLAGYVFAALALFLARPLALVLAMIGSGLKGKELAAASWFGPRGFSSVFFALLIVGAGAPGSARIFQIMALVIVASIILHSSTDVLVARWVSEEDNSSCSGGSSKAEIVE